MNFIDQGCAHTWEHLAALDELLDVIMMTFGPLANIVSVNVGTPQHRQQWTEKGSGEPQFYQTAIHKVPAKTPVHVGYLNLKGDQQADLNNHGGPDKAVHAHFSKHLVWFSRLAGRHVNPGEMGENLTLSALPGEQEPDENQFCLGDVVQIGSAILQVTQPRIPCYKQAVQLQVHDLVRNVVSAGRTGFYLRVLTQGDVRAGDIVQLLERPYPDWTIFRINQLLRSPNQPDVWTALGRLPVIGIDLRNRANALTSTPQP